MYRYVFKRVKDSFDIGNNVRKTFNFKQTVNNNAIKNNNNKQANSVIRFQQQEELNLLQISRQNTRKNHDDFKHKYNCRHPHCNPWVHAITWSTVLIAGFYTSQLLCLYRRNRLNSKTCMLSRYMEQKNRFWHRKLFYKHQQQLQQQQKNVSSLVAKTSSFFSCPLSRKQKEATATETNQKTSSNEDDFSEIINNFSQLSIFEKRFENFFDPTDVDGASYKVYHNVNNDNVTKTKSKSSSKTTALSKANNSTSYDENDAIDAVFQNLTSMIGEVEFQLGINCVMSGRYEEAVDHFKMSSNSNHAGAFFNLGLLYERGLGVKRDLQIAFQLYEIAANSGHDKALYNVGVYFARGLGNMKKSSRLAKMYFEKAATLGNVDATKALLMLPKRNQKLSSSSSVPDDFISPDYDDNDRSLSLISIKSNHNNNIRSIAVN